ncbi:hypothetical protein JTB14_033464 [Gonioctena quinquepunctata]|nr:hypothetical protein JTB14_033464 [Gonioctena quinquepunctata]
MPIRFLKFRKLLLGRALVSRLASCSSVETYTGYLTILKFASHKVELDINMFCSVVELSVTNEFDGTLVVNVQRSGHTHTFSDIIHQSANPNCFLCCLICYNVLRFSCGKRETCFNATDIVERNNDDDNLEDLEHAEEETVESEYIVKPGYLQVIRVVFGDGNDDDVGDHDAETIREADEQLEEIPTDQQPSTSDCQPSRKRRKRK